MWVILLKPTISLEIFPGKNDVFSHFFPDLCEFTIVYPVVELRGAATGWDQRDLCLEVIAIAHRLSTIRAYDEICVLQNGEIATW